MAPWLRYLSLTSAACSAFTAAARSFTARTRCPAALAHRLSLQPDLMEAPVVIDAVLLMHVALQGGVPTGRRGVVVDDRTRHVLGELALDLPDHRFAFL